MNRIASLFLVLAVGLWTVAMSVAQDASALFRKAPPELEESLRKTVDEFLALQLEKKWGAAMKYIAEDSYDAYIGSEKDACKTLKIFNITYGEDFQTATVGVICERAFATPVGGGVVQMPFTTYWRRVENDWKWFTPKSDRNPDEEMVMTPFGPVPVVTPDQKRERGKDVPDPAQKFTSAPSLEQLQAPIRVSPERVYMRADDVSVSKATIQNTFAGVMQVDLRWVALDGLSASIDKKELQSGETAEVTIRFEPPGLATPPRIHAVWVETYPMRSGTPITIEFQMEEEATRPKDGVE